MLFSQLKGGRKLMIKKRTLCYLGAAALLSACGGEQTNTAATTAPLSDDAAIVVSEELVAASDLLSAGSNNSEWLTHGRTYAEDRFSPLDQINQDSVAELGVAWSF